MAVLPKQSFSTAKGPQQFLRKIKMKAVLFAIAATFFYALQNVIVERKLSNVQPLVNMMFFSGTIFLLSLLTCGVKNLIGFQANIPDSAQILTIVFVGVILFFADYCFFSAYNSGGSLIIITTLVVLLPVIASFIKYASTGEGVPSTNQLLGWMFAAVAVFLVTK